ncbi:mRNA export factor mex67 like protein [Verticillium longisporum]|uniref:mRNA export factor mex67 like protein n=1 Tax=Verticillium longisporum TaxID=100787 RepID=A0A8I3AKI5_VERLO|nr:mRNA export factor mex67 like protein [Verticillium longisporum]
MAPPRSNRAPASAPKGPSRGGIQKRGRAGRVDQDGDLDMDSAAARRAARPARNEPTAARPQRGARTNAAPAKSSARNHQAIARHLDGEGADLITKKKAQSGPLVWLDVKGLKESKASRNRDGGIRDLISFIERKAQSAGQRTKGVMVLKSAGQRTKGVMVLKHKLVNDIVQIAATKENAEEFIKVNGFVFAGAKLEITDSGGSLAKATEASAAAQDLKSKLTSIMSQRYLTENKLLKLDALNQDQQLVEMGVLESKDRAEKLVKVMMKICDDLFKTPKDKMDNIHSISLANNGLDGVAQVEDIAETFPDLLNLDLSGNKIATLSGLMPWKGRLRKLDTLYITDNPIDIADLKVQAALLKFFPKLTNINGQQFTPEHLAELQKFTRPRPIPQHGPDFRDANGIGESFLLEFFVGFDTDSLGLLAKYYDDDSQFSLAVDTNSIRDKDAPQPMSWSAYIPKSRNLTRITTTSARETRLLSGREIILKTWNELPSTKHPDIKADTTKYIMDCHLLPGLGDPTGQTGASLDGLRSFSRSFVLAWNALPNVFVAAAATPAAAPPPVPAQEQELRQAKILELCKQTSMTPVYSEMCLNDTAWDFDRALAVFNEKKAQLPAEAFAVV